MRHSQTVRHRRVDQIETWKRELKLMSVGTHALLGVEDRLGYKQKASK